MDDDIVNSSHEGNGNGSDNNENGREEDGSSVSTASSSSSGTSSSDSASRSSSPARASSSSGSGSGSSEDESEHRTVENETPSEEVQIDYSDEEEKEMIAERSGRNEAEDVNVLVDDEEVKITDSDDEQEVKITDSDNGEEDVNAESKSGRNESIDDEKGEEIKIVEEEVDAQSKNGRNESIDDEEGEKIQIVDSDDDRDVNIDDMDVDHESNALGDHMEVEVKDEDHMKMAYDEREKEEQPPTDPIDEKKDETFYPSYYDRRLMLAQHAAEVVNPRSKRPREEVEEKREHVKRKKKDETLSMEIPTKTAEALSERILLNPVPRQPRLSVKTENKKINKGLVETLLMEMPPKAAEGLPELISVSPVRSQQGPSMKPEMKKESKNPSKESPVEALIQGITHQRWDFCEYCNNRTRALCEIGKEEGTQEAQQRAAKNPIQ